MHFEADILERAGHIMATLCMPTRKIVQIAYVVQDLDESVQRFARDYNIGGWVSFEHSRFERLTYRGQPGAADLRVALAYSGEMMFELVQQRDTRPSVFTEVIQARGYGFHHVAMAVASLEEAVRQETAKGYHVAMDVTVPAGRAVYIDSGVRSVGFLELMEVGEPLLEFLGFVYERQQELSVAGLSIHRM